MSSSEYWKQISNRVGIAEGFGPVEKLTNGNVPIDLLKREHEKAIQTKLKLMEMSPHLQNSEFNHFGLSKDKKANGVTARKNREIIKESNDPFWALTNHNNETVKVKSSKAIGHIKMKFQSDINRITDDLIESA